MSLYNTLCLSGGGIRGFELLGAVCYLQEILDFDSINNLIGTSVGGIINYLLAIGYSAVEILTITISSKIFEKKNFNIMQMIQSGGAISFSRIQELLETLTIKKIGKLINLKQLETDYGKTLTLITYNLSTRKKEILSPSTKPDIPCITALRMSSTLPFLFEPYTYESSLYLDGGLVDNFPVQLITEPEKAIAISLIETQISVENNFNPIYYGLLILNISINECIKNNIEYAKQNKIQLINIKSDKKSVDFNLSTPERLDLFSNGYNNAKKQYLSN